MLRAVLTYISTDNEGKEHRLAFDSGSLGDIVNLLTSKCKDEKELIKLYQDKVNVFNSKTGDITSEKVAIICTDRTKEIARLKPLYDGEKLVTRHDPFRENKTPETEKYRRLIFNGKNQLPAKLIKNDPLLAPSFNARIKITAKDFRRFKEIDGIYPEKIRMGDNYILTIPIKAGLQIRSQNSVLGNNREFVENCLEVWKEKMYELDDETLEMLSLRLNELNKRYEQLRKQSLGIKRLRVNNDYKLRRITINKNTPPLTISKGQRQKTIASPIAA